jgi:hypothetical protein
MKTLKQNSIPKFRNEVDKKALDYIIVSIENQLNECLEGTEDEITDKAYTLMVCIDCNASDLVMNRRLNKHFNVTLLDLYDYLILYDSERFFSIMKKLLNIEQRVYDVDRVVTNHLVYLLNKSLASYLSTLT